MPLLTEAHMMELAPLIGPFEGHPRKSERDLLDGEQHNDEFLKIIHDGRENANPNNFTQVTVEEVTRYKLDTGGSFADKCFLWVIDSESIKIIWELTPNAKRGASRPEKPYVCHTNITGSGKAYIGGEMYFCENGEIYVNFSSDRYGYVATQGKKKMAIQYIKDCNYKQVKNTEDNLLK